MTEQETAQMMAHRDILRGLILRTGSQRMLEELTTLSDMGEAQAMSSDLSDEAKDDAMRRMAFYREELFRVLAGASGKSSPGPKGRGFWRRLMGR